MSSKNALHMQIVLKRLFLLMKYAVETIRNYNFHLNQKKNTNLSVIL